MGNTTCVKIKPCKVGSSRHHNQRTAEYMRNIKNEDVYIRTELTANNDSWVSKDIVGGTLPSHLEYIQEEYKKKKGQKMQMKTVIYKDKNGKERERNGTTPIREAVIVIREGTTLQQLQQLCHEYEQKYGFKALEIYLHKDEGWWQPSAEKDGQPLWIPNYHAHVVFDWMNHQTWSTVKCNDKAMSDVQDMAAKVLHMERGESKKLTGRESLLHNDYVIAKQNGELKQIAKERQQLSEEIASKQEQSDNLTQDIADKKKQLDKEHGNFILGSAAILFGIGKYNEQMKEYEKLKEALPNLIVEQKKKFKSAVTAEAAKQTAPIKKEKDEMQRKYDAQTEALRQLSIDKQRADDEKNEAELKLKQQKASYDKRLAWRDNALAVLGRLCYNGLDIVKKAVDVILNFFKSRFNIFSGEEAKAVHTAINSLAKTKDERVAVGNWLVCTAEELNNQRVSDERIDHTYNEVEDIAIGNYDMRIQRSGQGMRM